MQIIFNSAHGAVHLRIPSYELSIVEICKLHDLPFQSLAFYLKEEDGKLSILKNIYTDSLLTLKQKGANTIVFQPNRNINFSRILKKNIAIEPVTSAFSSQYTFQSEKFDTIIDVEYNPEKCFDYIFKAVSSFISEVALDDRKLVVGISGGGDSNTLLKSLVNNPKIKKQQIVAVMCTGLNVWDSAKDRALHICKEVGVDLIFVDSEEICNIIGKQKSDNWDEAFFDVFEDSDIDALGTLIVRKVLNHYALKYNAQAMITGLNLEDLLAESFFQITKKKLPLPFPVRDIDNTSLWFPLYEVPKKILDGCYPKFSLENYEQRNPDKLVNRAVPYFFAQMSASILPGYEFDLLNGFKELSKTNTEPFIFDKDLGFSVTEPLSKELKGKWKYFTVC